MTGLRVWLRPPRNLLVFFILIVCLPAAALVGLGLRMLDQDRELEAKRQTDSLNRAADQAVRILEQDVKAQQKRLEAGLCTPADAAEDSVCIVFHIDRMEAVPSTAVPYYPRTQQLKEVPSAPFEELDVQEFRQDRQRALQGNRELANVADPAVRAGALLREGRILRRIGRIEEALHAYSELSRISSVSIEGEPADLVARRTRCVIFQEQSRLDELRQEAAALASDLRAGKWQLDRQLFSYLTDRLTGWLSEPESLNPGTAAAALADALSWLDSQRATKSPDIPGSSFRVLNIDGGPVTILWSFGGAQDSAFIAGPRYLESRWIAGLEEVLHPARVLIGGRTSAIPTNVPKVQRSAADTGLPWAVIVTGEAQPELPALAARRRNLAAGFAALLILTTAGSYFIWRAFSREMAVARLQSDFVSAVSHEFRTPLTALRQFNELLVEGDGPTPEKRQTFYGAQSRATDRLQRLVESLLDFGRMEAGRHPYKFQPLDAAALAQRVAEEFLREANASEFKVRCESSAGPHPVSADPDALSRALRNLLDNAVKYSGNSRNVEMNVSRSNGTVAIAVHDHGIGVPASEQKAIFQKFVRGAAMASGGIRGTGLGLAMVRHIVEAHHGTVKVESTEGRGSTFTIELPAKDGTE